MSMSLSLRAGSASQASRQAPSPPRNHLNASLPGQAVARRLKP
jgi:hypothetical protein